MRAWLLGLKIQLSGGIFLCGYQPGMQLGDRLVCWAICDPVTSSGEKDRIDDIWAPTPHAAFLEAHLGALGSRIHK